MLQKEDDVKDIKDKMAAALFESIPVGVGSESSFPTTLAELEKVLKNGIDWSVEKVRHSHGECFVVSTLKGWQGNCRRLGLSLIVPVMTFIR